MLTAVMGGAKFVLYLTKNFFNFWGLLISGWLGKLPSMTVSTQWWPTVACIFCLARTTIVVQAVFYLHIAQFLITVTYTGVVNFCTLRYLTLLAHCIFVSCLKFCLTTAICLPRFL